MLVAETIAQLPVEPLSRVGKGGGKEEQGTNGQRGEDDIRGHIKGMDLKQVRKLKKQRQKGETEGCKTKEDSVK